MATPDNRIGTGSHEHLIDRTQIWDRFKEFVRPEVRGIAQLINAGKNVIISGPNQVGKTRTLMPLLAEEVRLVGYQVENEEVDSYGMLRDRNKIFEDGTDTEIILPVLRTDNPLGDKRLLILDEASTVRDEDSEDVVKFFRYLKQRGAQFALINVARTPAARAEVATFYKSISPQIGTDFVEHQYRSIYIPVELATDYFHLLGAEQEVFDFIADPQNKALLTPGIFSTLYNYNLGEPHSRTVRDIRNVFAVQQVEGHHLGEHRIASLFRVCAGGTRKDLETLINNLGITWEQGYTVYVDEFQPDY